MANDSGTFVDSHSGIGSSPGAADSSRGFGSAGLAEILNVCLQLGDSLQMILPWL